MTKSILILVLLALIAIDVGHANIISLERYVIDTGAYAFYDPSIRHSGPQPAENLPIGTTYSEYVHYQTQNDETYIGVIEFLENVTLDSSGSVEANEPYPGFVTAENGTVRYFGKVNDKAVLVVNTTNIEMAAYLIKNLKVYPKSQENTLIASTVAKGLQS